MHRRNLSQRLWAGCVTAGVVALGVAASAPPASAGTVTILGQSRSISASARAVSPYENKGTHASEETTNAGRFDANASADETGAGYHTRARTVVASSIGEDGFTFKGTLGFDHADNRTLAQIDEEAEIGRVHAQYDFTVDFTTGGLTAFDYYTHSNTTSNRPAGQSEGSWSISGTDLNGDTVWITDDQSGLLKQGTYQARFWFDAESYVSVGHPFDYQRTYDIGLVFSQEDGAGPPNAIPLPPAALSGLTVLGLGALGRLRKHWLA